MHVAFSRFSIEGGLGCLIHLKIPSPSQHHSPSNVLIRTIERAVSVFIKRSHCPIQRPQPQDNEHMADNKQGSGSGPLPTLAEYKKSQARVRELIEKRRVLEKRLVRLGGLLCL